MHKILIVEDDPNINRALTIRLRAAGYEVVSATDAYLGFSAAMSEAPDVIILDISMPAGDGFSIVERMQEQADQNVAPFIFLTASKRPEYRERAVELGAHAYFEKPYESAELLESVHAAIHGIRDINIGPGSTKIWNL